MKRKYFGTDGVRGETNKSPMDPMTVLKLGMAAGLQFTRGNHRHRVVIGKDTRLSGYMVEAALESGFTSVGMEVVLVGPMPTPAIGMLTKSLRADLGVMISASHNPYSDNGIKLFGPDGYKLSDSIEAQIEKAMDSDLSKKLAEPKKLGRAKRLDDAPGRYIEFVKNTFPKGKKLDGLRIVIDCANGAAYQLGPKILWELGAEVIPLSVNPDGFNVNRNCGSTYPELICSEVKRQNADIGIALDGDADRLIICDEKGQLIDGDQIMAVIATYWKKTGRLKGRKIAATHMSNMGLEKYLSSQGIELIRTKIGDRYVLEAMQEEKLNIGGEQSGHIILSDYSTTGDGLVAALQILAVLCEKKQKASLALRAFKPIPQVLKNIKYSGKKDPLENRDVKKIITLYQKALGEEGRVFIRKSGTEPLIRIMVEAESNQTVNKVANDIAAIIKKVAGK